LKALLIADNGDNPKHTSSRSRDIITKLHSTSLGLLGEDHQITKDLSEMKQKNGHKLSLEGSNGKFGSYIAQIAHDLAFLKKSSKAGDNRADQTSLVRQWEDSSISQAAALGTRNIVAADNIHQTVDFFRQALQTDNHKVKMQLAGLNVENAGDLKTKIASMSAGDKLEISSGFGIGLNATLKAKIGDPTGAVSVGGISAGINLERINKHSIAIKKDANGKVTVEFKNQTATVAGLNVTGFVGLDVAGANFAAVKPSLSLGLEGSNIAGDSLTMTLSNESLQTANGKSFFDDLFKGEVAPFDLLSNQEDISSKYSNVLDVKVKVTGTIGGKPEDNLVAPFKTANSDKTVTGSFLFTGPSSNITNERTLFTSGTESSRDADGNVTKSAGFSKWFPRGTGKTTTSTAFIGVAGKGQPQNEAGTGVPFQATADFSSPTTVLAQDVNTLRPELQLIKANFETVDGVSKVTSFEWKSSVVRDGKLLENDKIAGLLRPGALDTEGAALLQADLVDLVSYTTRENRNGIKSSLAVVKTEIAKLSLSESDSTKYNAIIKTMEGLSDFGATNSGKLFKRVKGDQALFLAELKKLKGLNGDNLAITTALNEMNDRLADSSSWETGQRTDNRASVTMKYTVDGNFDPKDPAQMEQAKKQMFERFADAKVESISATADRTTETKVKLPFGIVSSDVSGKLTRDIASINIDNSGSKTVYDAANSFSTSDRPRLDIAKIPERPTPHSKIPVIGDFNQFAKDKFASDFKTIGNLFETEGKRLMPLTLGSELSERTKVAGSVENIALNTFQDAYAMIWDPARPEMNDKTTRRSHMVDALFDFTQAVGADASQTTRLQQFVGQSLFETQKFWKSHSESSKLVKSEHANRNILVLVDGHLTYAAEPGKLVKLPIDMMVRLQRENPDLEAAVRSGEDGTFVVSQPLQQTDINTLATQPQFTQADIDRARGDKYFDPATVMSELRNGNLLVTDLSSSEAMMLHDVFDDTGSLSDSVVNRHIKDAMSFDGKYTDFKNRISILERSGMRDSRNWVGTMNEDSGGKIYTSIINQREKGRSAQEFATNLNINGATPISDLSGLQGVIDQTRINNAYLVLKLQGNAENLQNFKAAMDESSRAVMDSEAYGLKSPDGEKTLADVKAGIGNVKPVENSVPSSGTLDTILNDVEAKSDKYTVRLEIGGQEIILGKVEGG
ncbi:MAG: hypothetical protein AB8B94_20350, partial [Hyphomicrobiales bacterium]